MTTDGFSCSLGFQIFCGESPQTPPFPLLFYIFNPTLLSQHKDWLEVRYLSRRVRENNVAELQFYHNLWLVGYEFAGEGFAVSLPYHHLSVIAGFLKPRSSKMLENLMLKFPQWNNLFVPKIIVF